MPKVKYPITVQMALEVAYHEAIVRQTYRDSVGVDTWSVGLTEATGHNVSRYINNPADMQHCINVYVWALDRYADQVRQEFRGYDLTPEQFTAALSFHWNTGAIRRARWAKSWKAGNVVAAKREIMNWVTPKEITNRRKAERDLFFDGKWSNNGTIPEITRLNSRREPIWSSIVARDITKEVKNAIGVNVVPDHIPDPTREFEPTVSNPHNIWTTILMLWNSFRGN